MNLLRKFLIFSLSLAPCLLFLECAKEEGKKDVFEDKFFPKDVEVFAPDEGISLKEEIIEEEFIEEEVLKPKCPEGKCDKVDEKFLTGIFAFEVTVKFYLIINLESKEYLLVEFEQSGKKVKEKSTLCEFNLPQTQYIKITIPEKLREIIASKVMESEGEHLSCAGIGAKYDPPLYTVTLGMDYNKCDIEKDPLPKKNSLECALDEDGDGNLGVTLLVDTNLLPCKEKPAKIYVALRTLIDFCGVVSDKNKIEGIISPSLEENVLGYNDECLSTATNLEPVMQDGTFVAVRVDKTGDIKVDANDDGKIDCNEFLAKKDEIFK